MSEANERCELEQMHQTGSPTHANEAEVLQQQEPVKTPEPQEEDNSWSDPVQKSRQGTKRLARQNQARLKTVRQRLETDLLNTEPKSETRRPKITSASTTLWAGGLTIENTGTGKTSKTPWTNPKPHVENQPPSQEDAEQQHSAQTKSTCWSPTTTVASLAQKNPTENAGHVGVHPVNHAWTSTTVEKHGDQWAARNVLITLTPELIQLLTKHKQQGTTLWKEMTKALDQLYTSHPSGMRTASQVSQQTGNRKAPTTATWTHQTPSPQRNQKSYWQEEQPQHLTYSLQHWEKPAPWDQSPTIWGPEDLPQLTRTFATSTLRTCKSSRWTPQDRDSLATKMSPWKWLKTMNHNHQTTQLSQQERRCPWQVWRKMLAKGKKRNPDATQPPHKPGPHKENPHQNHQPSNWAEMMNELTKHLQEAHLRSTWKTKTQEGWTQPGLRTTEERERMKLMEKIVRIANLAEEVLNAIHKGKPGPQECKHRGGKTNPPKTSPQPKQKPEKTGSTGRRPRKQDAEKSTTETGKTPDTVDREDSHRPNTETGAGADSHTQDPEQDTHAQETDTMDTNKMDDSTFVEKWITKRRIEEKNKETINRLREAAAALAKTNIWVRENPAQDTMTQHVVGEESARQQRARRNSTTSTTSTEATGQPEGMDNPEFDETEEDALSAAADSALQDMGTQFTPIETMNQQQWLESAQASQVGSQRPESNYSGHSLGTGSFGRRPSYQSIPGSYRPQSMPASTTGEPSRPASSIGGDPQRRRPSSQQAASGYISGPGSSVSQGSRQPPAYNPPPERPTSNYSGPSQAYTRPLSPGEAETYGLGSSNGYRAVLNPGSDASFQIVQDPPVPSNSAGMGAPSAVGSSTSSQSSWVIPNGPINQPGPLHIFPGQRMDDQRYPGPGQQHPIQQNDQIGTIQGLQQPQAYTQKAPAPEGTDTVYKVLADFFGKISQTAPIRMGQGGTQGGGGGGGGMPPNHLAVNFNNKFQALGIVNAQKQAGKGKTVYPDLTSEGGGPPPWA